MNPPRHPSLPVLALAAACLAPPARAQDPTAALLDSALARARAEIARTTDVWEDHSTWDKAWRVRTEHYEVRTVKSWALASNLANGLERMLEYYHEALGIDFVPRERQLVLLFPDDLAYNQYGQDHAEHSSFYGSFYANQNPELAVAAAPHPHPVLLRMQITHSAVHQYLAKAFPGTQRPLWIEEGLASYFALHWDYHWGCDELERIEAGRTWIGLRQLLNAPIAQYATRTHERFIELGMLFYYLLRFREDTRTTLPEEAEQRAPFRDYLLAVLRGQDATQLPAHQVLQDLDALEQDFRAYEFPR